MSAAERERRNSQMMYEAGSCKKALALKHERRYDDSFDTTVARRLEGRRGTRPERTSAPHAKRRPNKTSRSSDPLIAPVSCNVLSI
eukprot:scaffold15234_cov31-Tisochrysis_lutea.AAC.2